ncbi:hypothetical protein RhiJN_20875 [Ceratobasidium sp. AG-Ba]|nr:hypothetical protein RhiJN_20875 [Ceratobasidium sp. AG-Ba]
MSDSRMRRVKLPVEVIAMVLSELTHAEAWRLRILNSAVHDWVLNVLVKRALQATALVARAPGSFIFYEPPGNVHGLRFSFLQKHGAHAIFQAKTTDKREIDEFKKKTMLQIVVHLDNNQDPLIIRHLKLRDLSLDRDSVTLQCNWRTLFVSAFNMSPQQRSDQALSTSPVYVWQPAKVDGMPGKWKKGVTWLYSDSQASTVSQRSTSTTSSSQHLYGLVAYDSASGSGTTTSSSQNTQISHHSNLTQLSQHSNMTQITTSSAFSVSQLSQIGDVPQSSPPRHLGIGLASTSALTLASANMLNSLSVYPDSNASVSSDPLRVDSGSASSMLLGLVNPAPPVSDPGPATHTRDPLTPVPIDDPLASACLDHPYTPAPTEDREALAVASSPMSDSLAFSATIRPVLRGGGSSPLAGVLEEEEGEMSGEEREVAADMSWMYGSERDVSCMIGLEGESEFLGGTQEEEEDPVGETSGSGLARTESLGTTLAGSGGSVGVLSRMGSAATESTDVELGASQEEKGKEKGFMLGAAVSLPLAPRPDHDEGRGRGATLSPQVRRTRSVGARVVPSSSIDGPPSDVEEAED